MDKQAAIELISRYLDEEQWGQATTLCQQLLESWPDSVQVYRLFGKALVGQGQFDQAIHAYSQCLTLQPNQSRICC